MAEIVHVQTVMLQEELDRIKELSGDQTTKGAVYKAVEHYLTCPSAGKEKEGTS